MYLELEYLPGMMLQIDSPFAFEFDKQVLKVIRDHYESLCCDERADCLVRAYLCDCDFERKHPFYIDVWVWDAIFVHYYKVITTDKDGTKLDYFKDYDKIMASIKEEDHMVLDYMERLKDNITDCWHYCHDILDEDEIEDDPILRRLRRICEEEADDYGCEDATKYISEKYPDVYYSQT